MISKINHLSNPFSAISEIYTDYISNDGKMLSDLDIKLNLEKRNQVISLLQNKNIFGWLSSFKDSKSELEICLFPEDINSLFEWIEPLNDEPDKKLNALEFMSLHPSITFFEKTKLLLKKNNSDYKKYKSYINYWMSEYQKSGYSKSEAINYFTTIRTKIEPPPLLHQTNS